LQHKNEKAARLDGIPCGCVFKFVKDSFKQKRKNLRNNLQGYSLPIISSVLSKYGVDLTTRAESISLEIFIDLVNALFP